MNKKIPPTCSRVHSLGNSANERKIVVAFRAVEVMDIVSAPNDLVMAAEVDDPRNPVVEKRAIVSIFPETDHVGSKSSSISCSVPGRARNQNPSLRSPLTAAATKMNNVAMLYSRKMNSSCPTSNWFIRASLRLLMAPSHSNDTVSMMIPRGWNTAEVLASACMNMPSPATMSPTMAKSAAPYRFLVTITPKIMVKTTRVLFISVLAG
mmetsp:Transcript_13100/g.31855  ORF Transcript_13100/g.31855 Transcript_13100/m.31855 type:complete len:208 (+) Transcript_13100:329-952(+)